MSSAELKLALAQLPSRVRETAGLFRKVTGFTAVTSFMCPVADDHGVAAISPPMHPMCASRLHKACGAPPCEEEWQKHLEVGARDRSVQRHVCPMGLRCSCVPIYYGEQLAGVAKCVTGPGTDVRRYSSAIRLLELTVSKACQDLRVSVLSSQMEALQERVVELQEIRYGERAARPTRESSDKKGTALASTVAGRSLVDQALDYIAQHHTEHRLSLAGISRALSVNGNYLTVLFSRVVGQRMRTYIQQVRVQHACRLILSSDKPPKEVASDSGFSRVDVFRRTFQQYVGVSPSAYRRAFVRA